MIEAGCRLEVVGYDFETRTIERMDESGIESALERGLYVWLDVAIGDPERTIAYLSSLPTQPIEPAFEDAIGANPAVFQKRGPGFLHFVLSGCRMKDAEFEEQRLDVILSHHLLLTAHRGPIQFLDRMRADCDEDFSEHAQSPSFLVYELWDHLVENYVEIQQRFEDQVEEVQRVLIRDVNEAIFQRVAELGGNLLQMRKVLVPARSLIKEMASRKSRFVSEATQPFLAILGDTIERVLQDVMADRDILAGTLDLNMSMINYRTNEVVKRLTSVSIVFLPLTFLCGVWGMNFHHMPEIAWEWGYLVFWLLVVTIAGVQITMLRRRNLL